MKKLELMRMRKTKDEKGILGSLQDPETGKRICMTYELEDMSNQKDKSCIPLGVYNCKMKVSEKNGRVFELDKVKNRTNIQIHIGNDYNDTKGCILVGTKMTENSVTNSRYAMSNLVLDLPDEFKLYVTRSVLFNDEE